MLRWGALAFPHTAPLTCMLWTPRGVRNRADMLARAPRGLSRKGPGEGRGGGVCISALLYLSLIRECRTRRENVDREAAFSIVCCRLNIIFSSFEAVRFIWTRLSYVFAVETELFYKENREKQQKKNVKFTGELMQAHTENGWFNYTIAYHRFAWTKGALENKL